MCNPCPLPAASAVSPAAGGIQGPFELSLVPLGNNSHGTCATGKLGWEPRPRGLRPGHWLLEPAVPGSADGLCARTRHLFPASWLRRAARLGAGAQRGCFLQHREAKAEALSCASSRRAGGQLASLAPGLVPGLTHCEKNCVCGHGNNPSALVVLLNFCILCGELCEHWHLTLARLVQV